MDADPGTGRKNRPEQVIGTATHPMVSAAIDRTANSITFTANSARLAVLAGATGGPDETFRAAGLVNPTIVVRQGAHVGIELINADLDTSHSTGFLPAALLVAVVEIPTTPNTGVIGNLTSDELID